MAKDLTEIKSKIKTYILGHLLKNKNVENITDSTPLISGGLIDSIATMQLINFLEKEFQVEFEPHEVDKENFDTLDIISNFVTKKF
jgi:acyl carrier protein